MHAGLLVRITSTLLCMIPTHLDRRYCNVCCVYYVLSCVLILLSLKSVSVSALLVPLSLPFTLLPIADKAYRDMKVTRESQSIIVSGEYAEFSQPYSPVGGVSDFIHLHLTYDGH